MWTCGERPSVTHVPPSAHVVREHQAARMMHSDAGDGASPKVEQFFQMMGNYASVLKNNAKWLKKMACAVIIV